MICVFSSPPIQFGVTTGGVNVFVQRAATSAAEVTNEIIWLSIQ